jgi:hypothetical protein
MVSMKASKSCMNSGKSVSLSKATALKEKFCKLMEGSLFLYNKPIPGTLSSQQYKD